MIFMEMYNIIRRVVIKMLLARSSATDEYEFDFEFVFRMVIL